MVQIFGFRNFQHVFTFRFGKAVPINLRSPAFEAAFVRANNKF